MWKRIGGRTPIPANVEFGEGFYCESAQIFRKMVSKKPDAVVIGKHVSCYAGCSFAIGETGCCTIGDFTLLNGALVMAKEKSRSEHTAWFRGASEWRTRIFIRSNRAAIDRCAGARPLLQRSAAAAKIENGAGKDRRQRLDWK